VRRLGLFSSPPWASPHSSGLLTLRSGVFSRWVGIVALVGGVAFLVTFLAVIDGLGEDSLFGFGFFPGVVALVIWSIARSVTTYRAAGREAR
jgi:hypothetical protein